MALATRFAVRAAPLLALSLLPLSCGGGASEGPRHNVLLITLDTTRADRLSCYGHGVETTPTIDALAADGALFERAISTAGITPMSHAAILTGLNNYRHGIRVFYNENVSHRLKESVDTLPEILGARGWRTGATVSSYPVSEAYGLDQGFQHFNAGIDVDELDLERQQRHEEFWVEGEKTATQRRGDYTVTEALEWLDQGGGEPWCLWVHMFDVHDYTLVPPQEFAAEMGVTYDRSVRASAEWRERMYDPELRFMDAQIARLVEWLKANDQWEDTIVVVTADHGQGLLDGLARHGWVKHRILYDWCLNVPMVVRVPGEAPGVVVSDQVRTIDVLPTILEALDVASPDLEGESLLALMRGGRDDSRIAYADALNLLDEHSPGANLPDDCEDNLFCVSDNRWKLIWHETVPENVQLFDMVNDPLESTNVAADHPAEVERLYAFLEERGAMVYEPPEGESSGPNAGALNSLGYTGDDEEGAENEERESGR